MPAPPIAEVFADDEPIFASASASAADAPAESRPQPHEEVSTPSQVAAAEPATEDWDRQQQRLHQMNVAAVFGGEAADEDSDEDADKTDSNLVVVAGHSEQAAPAKGSGMMEEEEIEEEEADLAHYVDALEEDNIFEELEEETHAAGEHRTTNMPAGNRGLRGAFSGSGGAVLRRTGFSGGS